MVVTHDLLFRNLEDDDESDEDDSIVIKEEVEKKEGEVSQGVIVVVGESKIKDRLIFYLRFYLFPRWILKPNLSLQIKFFKIVYRTDSERLGKFGFQFSDRGCMY